VNWSASPALEQWHRRLHSDSLGGEFTDPTARCQAPDLWQVTFAPWSPRNNGELQHESYYLVRWEPPYRFAMVDIGDRPWPHCAQEDPEADAWRTLFGSQDWRQ